MSFKQTTIPGVIFCCLEHNKEGITQHLSHYTERNPADAWRKLKRNKKLIFAIHKNTITTITVLVFIRKSSPHCDTDFIPASYVPFSQEVTLNQPFKSSFRPPFATTQELSQSPLVFSTLNPHTTSMEPLTALMDTSLRCPNQFDNVTHNHYVVYYTFLRDNYRPDSTMIHHPFI